MRATHVITRLIVGGAQENTLASVLGLQRVQGWQVDLVSGPTTGPEGSLEKTFTERGGRLNLEPDLIRPVAPLRDLRALRSLTARFRETKPQIVHTHSGKAGILGRFAAARAGVPLIVHTVHGPSFGPFQGAPANALYRAAERRASRVTTHFVTVAEAMTQQYLAAGIGRPEQFTRVFSGFELAPFLAARNDPDLRASLDFSPDDFVVGKIARLFELKGHDDLFAVAPGIIRQCPRVKFLLVGDGPWRDRFEKRANQPDLAGHFAFTGLVPPKEVARYVGVMDALVHLSRREGLPRALPQAFAAAKPAVAYDCDGAREVCFDDRTGFLLPPGDLGGLHNRLLLLAGNPELCRRLGEAGRELVSQHFGEERMVAELEKLYRRLAAARGMSCA